MTRSLRLEIPSLPPAEYSANKARGAAWGRQYRVSHGKRGAADEIIAAVNLQTWEGPPMERARIVITFHLPDRRKRDAGMLQERMKPWFDALTPKGAGVIQDDDLATIGFPTYMPPVYSPRCPKTIMEIQEII